jgi:hypothetical protein
MELKHNARRRAITTGGEGMPKSATVKSCVCRQVGSPDADMHEMADTDKTNARSINYWRLWLLDAVLVSGGVLFFLAMQYGTYEFFGTACLMALMPFIPVMVLVGGAGSTIFALTKVKLIEKRSLPRSTALALLVAPAVVVALLLGLLGAGKSPARQLAYICLGNVPASASQVRVVGFSALLRGEWLAVFNVGQKDFQTMVAESKLAPVDEFEFRKMLELTIVKKSKLIQSLPPLNNALFFKRIFKESEEHQRGGVYAVFDPATSTAIVLRDYHD